MAYSSGQTAVIIPVPAAEAAVSRLRLRYDRSAPYGVPAHLTIVFPFVPIDRLSTADLADLEAIFSAETAFDLTFNGFGHFPGQPGDPEVLWLAPDPAGPFRRLTAAVADRWPETPPYSGLFDEIVPHLTVTDAAPIEVVERAEVEVSVSLPIFTRIDRGSLIAFDGVVWRERAKLPLTATSGSTYNTLAS